MKKLEIYGTLGPSCQNYETIKSMFEAGMTGMRLNLSHCNIWDKKDWLRNFYQAAIDLNITPDFLIDMRGPELRLPQNDDLEYLPNGSTISFSSLRWPKEIVRNLEINDHLLIDDGKLDLIVEKIEGLFIWCRAVRGGYLYGGKSITIKGKNITGDTLTQTDLDNLAVIKDYGVTGIMQPFVRGALDLQIVKQALDKFNLSHIKIYAKIENIDGFNHLEELLPYCDYVIIARGDLGNAVGLTRLPIIQKQIEDICNSNKKPYMVVTEMLSSMHDHQVPTRAEVSDIFHAVYNGASSIMLTGETASGNYPVQAMKYFVETAYEALQFKEQNF